MQLRGIIMCGGQSKRMGSDKGLIPIGSTCWSAYLAEKLRVLDLPVSISVNALQVTKYRSIFAADDLIVDTQNIDGPLNGLLSAHLRYPGDNLLLLACDMINMQPETLNRLITSYLSDTGCHNYYVYQNERFAEPFCGIYRADALHTLSATPSQLSGLSFQQLLNSGKTRRLPVVDVRSFDNFNTK